MSFYVITIGKVATWFGWEAGQTSASGAPHHKPHLRRSSAAAWQVLKAVKQHRGPQTHAKTGLTDPANLERAFNGMADQADAPAPTGLTQHFPLKLCPSTLRVREPWSLPHSAVGGHLQQRAAAAAGVHQVQG